MFWSDDADIMHDIIMRYIIGGCDLAPTSPTVHETVM
jgi:hypothetical protein